MRKIRINSLMNNFFQFSTRFSTRLVKTLWKTGLALMKIISNPLFNRVFHRNCGKRKEFLLFFQMKAHKFGILCGITRWKRFFAESDFFFNGCFSLHDFSKLIHNFFGEFGRTVEIVNTVLFLFDVISCV